MDKQTLDKANELTEKISKLENHLSDLIHGNYSAPTGIVGLIVKEFMKWPDGKEIYETELFEQFMPDNWMDVYRRNAFERLEELKQELNDL